MRIWCVLACIALHVPLLCPADVVAGHNWDYDVSEHSPDNAEQQHPSLAVTTTSTTKEAPADKGDGTKKHTPTVMDWLLWPFIVYLFWAQSLVCDEYFVPSVQVFSETFKIPEDVAGATVMALGCNGPELFVNSIALFVTHSAIGVGTIVGSDVFNLLFICGFSVIVAPTTPLKVNGPRLARDLTFYAASIGLLFWVLKDSYVEWWEAVILASFVVLFGLTVALWSKMGRGARRMVGRPRRIPDAASMDAPMIEEEASFSNVVQAATESFKPVDNSVVENFLSSLQVGRWISVRPGRRVGRMQGAFRAPFIQRYVTFSEHGVLLFIRSDDEGISSVMQLEGDTGNEATDEEAEADLAFGDATGKLRVEAIDVIRITAVEGNIFQITIASKEIDDFMGLETDGIQWELMAETEAQMRLWVNALERGIQRALRTGGEHIDELIETHRASKYHHKRRTVKRRLKEIVQWFCFPIKFCLEITIPECHEDQHRHLWPITFFLAMCWLGVFSFILCSAAELIHDAFGIKDSLLGLTLAAAGTSFPNLVASILVARRGQSGMAIANAIGSNIQNVFLALGFPWVAKALISPNLRFHQDTTDIDVGIMWMAGTLMAFAVLVALGKCTLNKVSAYLLVLLYVGFLVYYIFVDKE